jgi:hypothetical protein
MVFVAALFIQLRKNALIVLQVAAACAVRPHQLLVLIMIQGKYKQGLKRFK